MHGRHREHEFEEERQRQKFRGEPTNVHPRPDDALHEVREDERQVHDQGDHLRLRDEMAGRPMDRQLQGGRGSITEQQISYRQRADTRAPVEDLRTFFPRAKGVNGLR